MPVKRFYRAVIGILTVVASIETVHLIYQKMTVSMADLFLLFIYAEIIGMVGAFYQSSRIPVTLPIIIAITALCRLVVLHSKEMDAMLLMQRAQCNTTCGCVSDVAKG